MLGLQVCATVAGLKATLLSIFKIQQFVQDREAPSQEAGNEKKLISERCMPQFSKAAITKVLRSSSFYSRNGLRSILEGRKFEIEV